jgi:hypothetical protein
MPEKDLILQRISYLRLVLGGGLKNDREAEVLEAADITAGGALRVPHIEITQHIPVVFMSGGARRRACGGSHPQTADRALASGDHRRGVARRRPPPGHITVSAIAIGANRGRRTAGGRAPMSDLAVVPRSRMDPPPRSSAADAHDCIMVPIRPDQPNTSLWRGWPRQWRVPLGSSTQRARRLCLRLAARSIPS